MTVQTSLWVSVTFPSWIRKNFRQRHRLLICVLRFALRIYCSPFSYILREKLTGKLYTPWSFSSRIVSMLVSMQISIFLLGAGMFNFFSDQLRWICCTLSASDLLNCLFPGNIFVERKKLSLDAARWGGTQTTEDWTQRKSNAKSFEEGEDGFQYSAPEKDKDAKVLYSSNYFICYLIDERSEHKVTAVKTNIPKRFVLLCGSLFVVFINSMKIHIINKAFFCLFSVSLPLPSWNLKCYFLLCVLYLHSWLKYHE